MVGVAPALVEVAALDVLHRAGWQPVTRDAVTAWYAERSLHVGACRCWRCEAAAQANPKSVWRCLREWRWASTPPAANKRVRTKRRALLPEIRELHGRGLTAAQIADELQCGLSTVYHHLHSA